MPRKHRTRDFRSGSFQHVYTRGINRRAIFVDDEDRARFVDRMVASIVKPGTGVSVANKVEIAAYALMGNHFHLILRGPRETTEISRRMNGLLSAYARSFNVRHGRSGTLFDPNHFAARRITSGADLLGAITYTHLNPATREVRSAHTSDPFYRSSRERPWWLSNQLPQELFSDAGGYERYVAGTEWMRTARSIADARSALTRPTS